jgi:hypothetical protein
MQDWLACLDELDDLDAASDVRAPADD